MMASGASDETSVHTHLAPTQDSYSSVPSPTETMHEPLLPLQQAAFAEMRAQIIENGTVLFPFSTQQTFGANSILQPHLVVAKTPPDHPQKQQSKDKDQDQDQDQDQAQTSSQPAKPLLPKVFKLAGKDEKKKVETKSEQAKRAKAKAAQAAQVSAAALPPGTYYALLVRMYPAVEGYIRPPKVLLRGDARDTAVQALEDLLELTNTMIHQAILRDDIQAENHQDAIYSPR